MLRVLAMALVAAAQPGLLPAAPVPDPLEGPQWALDAVNATGAWALAPGRLPVVVAFVDTGGDLAHADLVAAYWDGNSLHGANVARPFGLAALVPVRTTMDDAGHGTLVAGIVGATRGNTIGVRGLADAPLMIVKDAGAGAILDVYAMADGIRWAVDHGARVVCVSQVALAPDPDLAHAVAHAEAAGAVVVAAAGNDGRATRFWPAAYPTVVSVGATDASGSVWSGSSYGKVDLVAPGVDVATTALGNGYALATGTSFAAPHAAAAAAMVLAVAPDLAPADVRALLAATARPVSDARAGAGHLDAGRAVAGAFE